MSPILPAPGDLAESAPLHGSPENNPGADPLRTSPYTTNRLLLRLHRDAPDEYGALLPCLEPVTHTLGAVLHVAGRPVDHVHLPCTSVCSVLRVMTDGRRVEVGTTGFEGMVGISAFLDSGPNPFECIVQLAGRGWRISTPAFQAAARPGSVLFRVMQCFVQYRYDQAAQAVACNRLHDVEARCARWLLMTHDRVRQAARFPLTHEFLAIMLGVRRASVSVAAEALRRAGYIDYRRGIVTVTDRGGLETASCECYHTDCADYARLLG